MLAGLITSDPGGLLFASLRAGAAYLVVPAFAVARIPIPIRVIAGLSVGLMSRPVAGPLPDEGIALILAAAGELMIGLAIGMVAQIAFAAVSLAGEAVAATLGLSFATLFDPANGQTTALGELFRLFAAYLFFSAGGHAQMIAAIVASYASFPPGAIGPFHDLAWRLCLLSGEALAAGVAIALPLGVAMLGLNLIAAFATRAAPQLNMFAIAVPMTLAAGMAALLLFTEVWTSSAAEATGRLTAAGYGLFGP